MEEEYLWETENAGYPTGYFLQGGVMTMHQAECIFRLDPEPPRADSINDYILAAVEKQNPLYFTYFLHHYEPRLNRRINRFLLREGSYHNDPERFLDYKQSCVLAMLECLYQYEPGKGADFLTYSHHFVGNALLNCRRQEEAGSFKSLDEYKAVRGIAWLYNAPGKSTAAAIAEYAAQQKCAEETAAEYLRIAQLNRSRGPFYITVQDEDSEETGEDVSCDNSWNYAQILWNGIAAKEFQAAFEQLSYREQTLLEKRNAVCMTCGRVGAWESRLTFEELAVLFEGSSASGAERAYKKALEKLTLLLVSRGLLHAVRLKLTDKTKQKKKITAAVYQYQADCDGDWGEIRFDFENGSAEILSLADWATTKTNRFAKEAIRYILGGDLEKLPKCVLVPFDWQG